MSYGIGKRDVGTSGDVLQSGHRREGLLIFSKCNSSQLRYPSGRVFYIKFDITDFPSRSSC